MPKMLLQPARSHKFGILVRKGQSLAHIGWFKTKIEAAQYTLEENIQNHEIFIARKMTAEELIKISLK